MIRALTFALLLAPVALPQSGPPPGGISPNITPAANETQNWDPTQPATWGLPMIPGLPCIPWPIFPPPFPVPLPWWGP